MGFEDDRVVFVVPEQMKNRLNVEVYVYKFLSDSFDLLKDVEPIGHNYWTQQKIKPVSSERFDSVIEAIEHFGGEVRYK
ncbi:MAG: hypothetical protein NT077_03220 [Candidatus Taylorbacteria bacterium]|nr:hypothetical protein [Candidatus Taylorbacteria bacterium]